MIILIIGHFLTSAKFHEIPWQYQNSAEKDKFRGLAQNSVARGKPWALVIRYKEQYLSASHRTLF